MRCGPISAQPSLVAKLSCSNKLARPMMRFCESRRPIQRRAWFCSPNIKPKGEDSEAIAGIGINVNQSLEDFPRELQSRAISLAMALDRQVNRQKFAIALLRNLDRSYRERFC